MEARSRWLSFWWRKSRRRRLGSELRCVQAMEHSRRCGTASRCGTRTACPALCNYALLLSNATMPALALLYDNCTTLPPLFPPVFILQLSHSPRLRHKGLIFSTLYFASWGSPLKEGDGPTTRRLLIMATKITAPKMLIPGRSRTLPSHHISSCSN